MNKINTNFFVKKFGQEQFEIKSLSKFLITHNFIYLQKTM